MGGLKIPSPFLVTLNNQAEFANRYRVQLRNSFPLLPLKYALGKDCFSQREARILKDNVSSCS